jgi:hypothetical protein
MPRKSAAARVSSTVGACLLLDSSLRLVAIIWGASHPYAYLRSQLIPLNLLRRRGESGWPLLPSRDVENHSLILLPIVLLYYRAWLAGRLYGPDAMALAKDAGGYRVRLVQPRRGQSQQQSPRRADFAGGEENRGANYGRKDNTPSSKADSGWCRQQAGIKIGRSWTLLIFDARRVIYEWR